MNPFSDLKKNFGIFLILTSISITLASWSFAPGLKNFYANSNDLLGITSLIEYILSPFLHINFIHLFGNMILLMFIWQIFTQNINKNYLLPFFLISEAIQYTGIVLLNNPPTAGISGFIFGIFGYMGLVYYFQNNPEYKGILFYTAISFFLWGIQDPNSSVQVSHSGHFLGLISGILWYGITRLILKK